MIDPIFESQTKNKLGNIETRGNVAKEVQKIISEILYKDKILAKLIEKKVVDNERLRKELSSVRKEARERAKKISFKIPKLKDCKFHFNDSSKQSEQTMIDQIFESKNGLLDFLNSEIKSDDLLYDIVYYSSKTLEFAFSHTNNYGETYFSFVNGQYTNDGGTHQTGFREGFVRAINDFLKKTYSSTDIREGLVATLSVKIKDRSTRNGKSFEALFSKGKLLESREIKSSDKDGTYVEFLADSEIFGKYSYSEDFLKRRFFHYACLNKGLIINYNDRSNS